jgi:hypothetical protein
MPTIADLQTRLALYRSAEAKILSGAQSTTVGDTVYTYANLAQVQSEIRSIENSIAQASRPATTSIVFRGRGAW